VERCVASVRRLSSLLGLAALACLFNLRRLGKRASLFDTTSRPYPCLLSPTHQHILVCIIQILNDVQEAGGHAIASKVLLEGTPKNGVISLSEVNKCCMQPM